MNGWLEKRRYFGQKSRPKSAHKDGEKRCDALISIHYKRRTRWILYANVRERKDQRGGLLGPLTAFGFLRIAECDCCRCTVLTPHMCVSLLIFRL